MVQWHSLSYQPNWVLEVHPSCGLVHRLLVVEPWLLLAGSWEGFTQASQLQGLAVTTDYEPLPSMEDQLCRGRMVVL